MDFLRCFSLVICVQHSESAGFIEEGTSCSLHSCSCPGFVILWTKNQSSCTQTHSSRSSHFFSDWQWGERFQLLHQKPSLSHSTFSQISIKALLSKQRFTDALCSFNDNSFGQKCVTVRFCGKICDSAESTWSRWWLNTRGVVVSVTQLARLKTVRKMLHLHSQSVGMKGRRCTAQQACINKVWFGYLLAWSLFYIFHK